MPGPMPSIWASSSLSVSVSLPFFCFFLAGARADSSGSWALSDKKDTLRARYSCSEISLFSRALANSEREA